MSRGGWKNADDVGIADATSEEIDRFLNPLLETGLQHFGWKGFDPVFRIPDGLTVTRVRSDIQSLLDSGRIRSAGHKAYIVNTDYESGEPSAVDSVIMLKVEDWMTGCIPNTMHDKPDQREEYISEREEEISKRVQSEVSPSMTVLVDRHVGHGGRYGQYQFMAVKDN